MIPTSVTSSSPPTAAVGGVGSLGAIVNNSPIIPSANGSSNHGQGNNIALLGIASLILEGRALAEDEYAIQTSGSNLTAAFNRNTAECGRQSPKPSTSRAAFEDFESVSNASYLRRIASASNSPESTSSLSLLRDYYSSGSESASSSVESNHSRLSQKLSQLRQESPTAHHHALTAREKVAVECPRSTDAEYVALTINTNLHGLNNEERRGDFEIRRRIALNCMNLYNLPASTGSGSSGAGGFGSGSRGGYAENFMCSLQSLASNTCLRAGTPLLPTIATTSSPTYQSTRPRFPTPQKIDLSDGLASSFDSGVQSPVYSPHLSGNNNNKDYHKFSSTQRIVIPSAQQTSIITTSTPIYNLHSNVYSKRESLYSTATAITMTPTSSRNNQIHPQQGPHCDQFLKKMGLAKGDALETEEHHCDMSYVNTTCTRWRAYCFKIENILARGEPVCIEVYLGPVGHKILLEQWIITQKEKQPPSTMTLPSLCSAIRSQLYFSQISAWCDLIKKSDNTIYETGRLIINNTPSTTKSAAGDLATKNNAMSTSPTPTTAAPLTTSTTTTAASSMSSAAATSIGSGNSLGSSGSAFGNGVVGCGKRRPLRLNIFYRIKQYDSTACFNSKPNVHNFPNVNISENCTVSVCLKSLPRSKGGIPKIGTSTPTQKQQQQHNNNTAKTWATAIGAAIATATPTLTTPQADLAATLATTSYLAAKSTAPIVATTATATPTTTNANKPTISTMNCDNNLKKHHQQKPLTANPIASPSSSTSASSTSATNDAKSKESASFSLDNEDHRNDFESEQNVDLNAGGDSNISSCSGGIGGDTGSICDGDSSNSSFSRNYCGNFSHREKQLLKYHKLMLKRDKKQHHQRNHNEINTFQTTETETDTENTNNKMEQGDDDDVVNSKDGWQDEENEEVEKQQKEQKRDVDKNHHQIAKGQRQRLPNNHINSIPSTNQQQQQQQHVKMISTGTQTIANTCTSCGSDKSMICLKCYPSKNYAVAASTSCSYEDMEAESSSASSLSSSDIIHTPRNKAELLLQAIQRTPKSNKKHKKSKDLQQMAAIKQSNTISTPATTNNNHDRYGPNHFNSLNGNSLAGVIGCQVCKRQKTQHIFSQPPLEDLSSSEANSPALNISCNNSNENKSSDACDDDDDAGDDDNDTDGGKMLSSDCVDNVSATLVVVVDDGVNDCVAKVSPAKPCDNSNIDNEIMDEEYFQSSTKLTPHIDRCSLNTYAYNAEMQRSYTNERAESQQRPCCTPPLQCHNDNCPNQEGGSAIMAQFKTPTPSEQHSSFKNKATQPVQPHKHTPKPPNLLQIACNFNRNDNQLCKTNHSNSSKTPTNTNTTNNTTHNPLLVRRSLPKVNLTPIFCNPSSMMVVSSPIPIGNGVCNGTSKTADINITQASPTFSFESPSSPAPSLTVQKSNSAPTLPNSPSLSPRFVKSSTINKRRSRHLSDRSDRSSLGSDEQFSDEDLDSGMYSPFATSPTKFRTRLATVFGRKPLLGNLEENLLQRRLVPKVEVMGFKLLLGASGGFCPTQLTIPAATYFYELKGDTLSTPYLCEIRLPRKGYTVPRCGTVQATLLNPMGTVVRMFVIPYDMRDMPNLHQTFIKQRILADSGLQQSNSNAGQETGVGKTVNGSGDNATINTKQNQHQQQHQRSPQFNNEHNLGHFISAENMKSLRYSIHLRFQSSRTGRLMLHTDIRLLISRRTDCDTAAAHAKGVLEAPNELITNIVMPTNPKYSARQEQTSSKM